MKSSRPPSSARDPWQRLVATARLASDDKQTAADDASAPYAFAARVTALGLARAAEQPTLASVLAHFAGRAFGVAALVMLVSVSVNVKPALTAITALQAPIPAESVVVADTATDWLDLS